MIDLVARNLAGPITNIIIHAGKARAPKPIDIVKRVETIGEEKLQALFDFYDFTWNGYGHKWTGVPKKLTMEQWFFSLPSNHFTLNGFSSLGTLSYVKNAVPCPHYYASFSTQNVPMWKDRIKNPD